MCVCLCIFFFSSRRRHTRCSRDWSSDVCSSDLPNDWFAVAARPELVRRSEVLACGPTTCASGVRSRARVSLGLEFGRMPGLALTAAASVATLLRSEEHTSELQSRLHLVCRLLLEKKKKKQPTC